MSRGLGDVYKRQALVRSGHRQHSGKSGIWQGIYSAEGSIPGYSEGDRVRHIKFGEGTVKSIRDGGKDYEVTVVFDGAGQKKMFASFAKLKKV